MFTIAKQRQLKKKNRQQVNQSGKPYTLGKTQYQEQGETGRVKTRK